MLCISSLSSCKTNTDDTSPTEVKEVEHKFQMQRLYYEDPATTFRGYTLQVKVFADGYTCINCGAKYHTNEIWKCYMNEDEVGSSLTSLYLNTGLSRSKAAELASGKQRTIKNHLYDYYYSLGYEKTSCYTKCTK